MTFGRQITGKMNLFRMGAKQLALRIMENYRRFLLTCHGYSSKGVMPKGTLCYVEDPTIEVTHGDVVHPCVRYIEEGFEGHQWWMVYTPYYAENCKYENPRLCYADTVEEGGAIEWKFYCFISNLPEYGYNSDPTMLFYNNMLYVFWRENYTSRTRNAGLVRITIGCKVCEKKVTYLSKHQLMEASEFFDKEVCPTIIARDNVFRAYAIHMDWNPDFVYRIPPFFASKLFRFKIIPLLDVIGLCNIHNSLGVSIWESDSLENTFHYIQTVQFKNASSLYQPWHMDLFSSEVEKDKGLYAVVQTRLHQARICLARSYDEETFVFYDKPLLTSKTTRMIGLYKPTAIQVGSKFFLYYTALDDKDVNLHRLYVTSIDWNDLLCKMANN